jgi:hypothetical protein
MLRFEFIIIILIIFIFYLISGKNESFDGSYIETFSECPTGLRSDGKNCWEDKKCEPPRWDGCCSKIRTPGWFGRARDVCIGCLRPGNCQGCGCIKQPANLPRIPTNIQPANLPNIQPANLPNIQPANLPNIQPANSNPPTNIMKIDLANIPKIDLANIPKIDLANLPKIDLANIPMIDLANIPMIDQAKNMLSKLTQPIQVSTQPNYSSNQPNYSSPQLCQCPCPQR